MYKFECYSIFKVWTSGMHKRYSQGKHLFWLKSELMKDVCCLQCTLFDLRISVMYHCIGQKWKLA
jgi:hypothetical protein